MLAALYSYHGIVRWSGPWQNPNCLGAFLAMLLPFACALSLRPGNSQAIKSVGGVCEAAIFASLCFTYSRGSWIAATAAYIWLSLLVCRPAFGIGIRPLMTAMIVRAGLGAGLAAVIGLGSRMLAAAAGGDSSAANRLTMWLGGVKMISGSPLFGWGFTDAAPHYVQWFQPLDRTVASGNLVNAFLQLAVDCGLLVAGSTFVLLFLALLVPTQMTAGPGRLGWVACCSSAGLLAFLVANFFSVLGGFVSLDILPLGFVLFLGALFLWCDRNARWKLLRQSAVGASALVLLLFASSHVLARADSIQVRRLTSNSVQLGLAAKPSRSLHVFPDPHVLGREYGKEMRRLVHLLGPEWRIVVHHSTVDANDVRLAGEDRVLWTGGTCRACPPTLLKHSIFLHPVLLPGDPVVAVGQVILPGIDEHAQNALWTNSRGSHVSRLDACGVDARGAWLKPFAQLITE